MFRTTKLALLLGLVALGHNLPAQEESVTEFDVLNGSVAQQWVRTNPDGSLTGRVETPSESAGRAVSLARVALLPMSGTQGDVQKSRAGLDGAFTFDNVPSGTYGLVIKGESVIGAYTIHVLPASQLGSKQNQSAHQLVSMQPASVTSDMLQALAAPASEDLALKAIRSYVPVATAKPFNPHTFTSDPRKGKPSRPSGYRVSANADGDLIGRLSLPTDAKGERPAMKNMNVMIVRGNKTIQRAATDESGKFKFEGLSPGVYGLFAAGDSGFGSVGFEFVPNAQSASVNRTNVFQPAALRMQEEGEGLSVEIIPSDQADEVEEVLEGEEPTFVEMEPVLLDEFGWPIDPSAGFGQGGGFGGGYGGGFSGGASGGGGGGGTFGGADFFAAAAAIGAGIIASENNDSRNLASPAVPAP